MDRVRVKKTGMFEGCLGTIVRRRIADDGFWVQLDEWPIGAKRVFQVGDPRQNNIILYPEDVISEIETGKR
jgi:hypothetical protein